MHYLSAAKALEKTDSTPQGITYAQAKRRLGDGGKNEIKKAKKKSFIKKALAQLKDPMIIILLLAAAASFAVAFYDFFALSRDALKLRDELLEGIVIFLIVLANALLGAAQEHKAENAMEELQKLTVPYAKVMREGEIREIPSSDVAVGDVISLAAGDVVPADCRLLTSLSLEVDQSALTGESKPAKKNAQEVLPPSTPLAERGNCLYSSSSVVGGQATGVVFSTGYGTEVGKIALALEREEEKTPLQKRLAALSKTLGVICLIISAFCFVLGILQNVVFEQNGDVLSTVMTYFLASVSLAVAAIPEGLPTVVTIVLSRGVSKLVSNNAIVKKLASVETLGSASVICTDKTGTLTLNVMSVVKCAALREENLNNLSLAAKRMFNYAYECCNAQKAQNDWEGSATEKAICTEAERQGEAKKRLDRLKEVPFESRRKLMSVVVREGDKNLVVTKGAWEKVASLCKNFDKEVLSLAQRWSSQGLRVLAVAIKEIEQVPKDEDVSLIESKLNYIGLIAIADKIRKEAKKAVLSCYGAGIKPVMLTGDHPQTAVAIASQAGIIREKGEEKVITGAELENMTDDELSENVENCCVFARVTPSDKLRIVSAYRKKGHVVALIGDGVNDAPALKFADIGCAMGRGVQVAKQSADMVLTDDNFSTVVEAVKVGRIIYDNLRQCVQYLLSCNIGEVLVVLLAMTIFRVTPLLAIQLLWINLVTDTLPAVAIGMRKGRSDIMTKRPRKSGDTFFDRPFTASIAGYGACFGIVSFIAFLVGKPFGFENTMVFLVLSLSQLVFAVQRLSDASVFKQTPFSSKSIIILTVVSFLLALLPAFPPFYLAFELQAMPFLFYLGALLLSLVPSVVAEIKYASNVFSKRQKFDKISLIK